MRFFRQRNHQLEVTGSPTGPPNHMMRQRGKAGMVFSSNRKRKLGPATVSSHKDKQQQNNREQSTQKPPLTTTNKTTKHLASASTNESLTCARPPTTICSARSTTKPAEVPRFEVMLSLILFCVAALSKTLLSIAALGLAAGWFSVAYSVTMFSRFVVGLSTEPAVVNCAVTLREAWLSSLAAGFTAVFFMLAYCVTLLRSEPTLALVCALCCLVFAVVFQLREFRQKAPREALLGVFILAPLTIVYVGPALLTPPLLVAFLKIMVQKLAQQANNNGCSGLCAALWALERGTETTGVLVGVASFVLVLGLVHDIIMTSSIIKTKRHQHDTQQPWCPEATRKSIRGVSHLCYSFYRLF